MAPSTDVLLTRVGNGDAAAFAELYDLLSARVHGLMVRVLRDPHQAEAVTLEAFAQVWRTASRFEPQRGSGQSWVLALAHRAAVERLRGARPGARRDGEAVPSGPASPEAQRVQVALAALPTPQRLAVELAYWGGHTHSEVSRLLQIPVGTARSRIRDGLIALRTGLGPVAADPA